MVAPGPEERNYHIFYHLLKGGSEELKAKLGLGGCDANSFDYLKAGNCVEVNTISDVALW